MQTDCVRTDIVAGVSSRSAWVLAAAGVIGFALLTALGAAVRVPLPFTPVPMTLQTLFVLLAGVTLGPRLGTASMAFYLLLGTAGYHVFAGSERCGLQTIFGPTGGYLLGFLLAQPLLGVLAHRRDGRLRDLLPAVLTGTAVIYGCGLLGLVVGWRIGWSQALALGLYPFLAGEILKTALAIGLGRILAPRARRFASAGLPGAAPEKAAWRR